MNRLQLYSAASQLDNIAARELSLLAQRQSALAQKSNELNLRMATSTKKDSIAMMAFTFVSSSLPLLISMWRNDVP